MRVNKLIILLIIMVMLSPALSILGVDNNFSEKTTLTPSDVFNASVGVEAGDLIYWDLDQLVLPDQVSPPAEFPDLAGNQIYMKILDVFNTEIAPGIDDNILYFAVGMKFLNDLAFTVGSPPLETEFIIPAGSVTPSVGLSAQPHINNTGGFGPLVIILNEAWNEHEILFEAIGMTVTNGVDTFEVEATNGTGTISGTWQKSDGICTHLLFDNIWWYGLNFLGGTVEISFSSKENNPLPVTVGDNIELILDTAQADITGSGPIWEGLNQTQIDEGIAEYEALEGIIVEKAVVEYVFGTFYGCGVYAYNMVTEALEKVPNLVVVYNGFQGCIQISQPNQFPSGPDYTFIGGILAPWITPDWDIYEGHAMLYNTFIGTYLVDIIQLMGIEVDEAVYHSIAGSFELEQKKDYYYFHESIQTDYEENLSYTSIISIMNPMQLYEEGMHLQVDEEAYICYTETGVAASFHIKADVDLEYYDTENATAEDIGTINANIEIKIRNTDYNPPELIRGGILPGFNWFAVIPALFIVATVSVIIRKRKWSKKKSD